MVASISGPKGTFFGKNIGEVVRKYNMSPSQAYFQAAAIKSELLKFKQENEHWFKDYKGNEIPKDFLNSMLFWYKVETFEDLIHLIETQPELPKRQLAKFGNSKREFKLDKVLKAAKDIVNPPEAIEEFMV